METPENNPKNQGSSHARKPSIRDPHAHSYKCCGSTKCCWWEPDMADINNTVDFTQETSLHGLRFICQPQRHLFERYAAYQCQWHCYC